MTRNVTHVKLKICTRLLGLATRSFTQSLCKLMTLGVVEYCSRNVSEVDIRVMFGIETGVSVEAKAYHLHHVVINFESSR